MAMRNVGHVVGTSAGFDRSRQALSKNRLCRNGRTLGRQAGGLSNLCRLTLRSPRSQSVDPFGFGLTPEVQREITVDLVAVAVSHHDLHRSQPRSSSSRTCRRGAEAAKPSWPGRYGHLSLYSGSSHVYDPWVLYARGLITAPNLVLAGVVGAGKSALAKSLYARLIPFGRRV
ncbi:hypothetical protein [Nocardioides sp. NBC_00850]|uniref:hypothetical protein n=1 Tax=Nocardioides sp. NBC_00850 TaxID=2976001 RepID=UPI0038648F32